jgi:hypothetical protein
MQVIAVKVGQENAGKVIRGDARLCEALEKPRTRKSGINEKRGPVAPDQRGVPRTGGSKDADTGHRSPSA